MLLFHFKALKVGGWKVAAAKRLHLKQKQKD